ncbi:MSMEG_0569 family flavin-dependent oxidoreductase [Pantoea cypripedii]|uniref:FAD-dependent oxidoreductase n=1 Tax=Pantoea cypripedii TaxID=55209 RepID=A0A1X1ELA1_PANCY|nr:MSMEG_0569 family flavin-dependent oxidoreductase [Pantoea cypripedii]MBP2200000.1 putative flavoprotein involved in K+ transport [Pantoea cypripedii]ORM89612.1 FAD-dependent oxidoreductase [Pantoea cypripedii]
MNNNHYPVVIIGGGQAGLAMSWNLTQKNIRHMVLERHQLAWAWREQRWDNFCLVTPNWQCKLPGFPYDGDDPHGFMLRDEIIDYVARYARSFNAPVREGVNVLRVEKTPQGFQLLTSAGVFTADQVVIAVGNYHRPRFPGIAAQLPENIMQVHSADYKSAQQLPAGEVLVVGSAQSGAQIAEDLHLAGRRVHLCVGSAPRVARFYRGRDVVDWLDDMGHYRLTIDDHPLGEDARRKTNHYVTGRDGGRDIDLRAFALQGMQLYGRLLGYRDGKLLTADDLKANLDGADATSQKIKDSIDVWIAEQGIDAPTEARYQPLWQPEEAATHIDLTNIAAIIWAVGFHTDFSWIDAPAFNDKGYPRHTRGVSVQPGLYFLGLPWLWTWGSGRFEGVGEDAAWLAEAIEQHHQHQGAAEAVYVNDHR